MKFIDHINCFVKLKVRQGIDLVVNSSLKSSELGKRPKSGFNILYTC
jgi:hypothetical protein